MSKLFTSYELDRVMDKLYDILTVAEDEKLKLRPWVKGNYPDEIRPLADVFSAAGEKLHHKWAGALLATVPESAWDEGPGGLLRLKTEGTGASLRYLSNQPVGAEALDAIVQAAARKELLEGLLSKMPVTKRLVYRDMMQWRDSPSPALPLAGDSRFGLMLTFAEKLLDDMVHMQEQQWRQRAPIHEDESTPVEMRCEFSFIAMRQFCFFIEWCCAQQDGLEDAPESLMALVSANISCNRVLLEMAALDARGEEAAKMCTSFLQELNRNGVTEVPHEMDSAEPNEVDDVLRQLLKSWFAYGGAFLQDGSYFARHMTITEIDMVVLLSRELQQSYIAGRGGSGGNEHAMRGHGGNCNRFIFALVLVAAFYSHADTEHEFKTSKRKNATYAIFPSRHAIANERVLLPKHAEDALLKAYGQVFYANSGWQLLAEGVRTYALSTQVRRMHLQLAMNWAVKGRSSRELLALFRRLQEFHEHPEEALVRMQQQPSDTA